MSTPEPTPLRGYIEGYYGRLLSWADRLRILDTLEELGMNCFLYAPKEDANHRYRWREPYGEQWRWSFRTFCAAARAQRISVVAGIAPGLDFNFAQVDGGSDLQMLCNKAMGHLADGAASVALLLDDIDERPDPLGDGQLSEAHAHAQLANRLSEALGQPVFVLPRVYAHDSAVGSANYLAQFSAAIDPAHPILFCGATGVARHIAPTDLDPVPGGRHHRVIAWDNLYANDYCPRRLFVGPWTGRHSVREVLLNPTGLIETDILLLQVMAACTDGQEPVGVWKRVILENGVPEQFFKLARYVSQPAFDCVVDPVDPGQVPDLLEALDTLQWNWKTPLSREWYPFLMGLRHDLLYATHQQSDAEIFRTQTPPLASALLRGVSATESDH